METEVHGEARLKPTVRERSGSVTATQHMGGIFARNALLRYETVFLAKSDTALVLR